MLSSGCLQICAVFKLVWDIKCDWKLLEPDAPNWRLRKRLVYPPWVYYYAICQDAVLRFTWVLTISPSFFHLNSISDMCAHFIIGAHWQCCGNPPPLRERLVHRSRSLTAIAACVVLCRRIVSGGFRPRQPRWR